MAARRRTGRSNAREQLAIFCYMKAQQNGSRLPGETHISKQASTTHHKQGIERMLKGM